MAKHLDSFFGLDHRPMKTLDEACVQYGFDFDVEKRPLAFADTEGKRLILSPYNEQTVRVESNHPLGCVGLVYTVVPYRDAFAPVEKLIEGGARIVAGGAPNHGERAYLVLEAEGKIVLADGDDIVNRFVFQSSHDGSSKIEVRMTPYRKKNGTTITHDATRPLAFKHTTLVNSRVSNASKVFDRVNKSWSTFQGAIQRMIATKLTEKEAKDMIDMVLGGDVDRDSQRLVNIKTDIFTIYKHTGIGTQIPKCKGTVFGMMEAFAEWADRHRTIRKSNKRSYEAASLDAKLVSDGARKKQKAFAVAIHLSRQAQLADLNAV